MLHLVKKLNKEQQYYALSAAVGLLALGLLVYFVMGRPQPETVTPAEEVVTATSTPAVLECEHVHRLNGVCVSDEARVISPMVGVMIENHTEARPQAGIARARVVYEAPVEGNITRFLALFDVNDSVERVGPVRSARPYYLDVISEYADAMYLHVGGSPDALERIAREDVFSVNEFYRGAYFWRDQRRYAPHNVYTSSDLWNGAWDRFSTEDSDLEFGAWNFSSATSSCEQDCSTGVSIPFLRPSYVVSWQYDAERQQYARFQAGAPHVDEDHTPVFADTVVVQSVSDRILDSVGRRALGMVGEGPVVVLTRGKKVEGVWKKKTVSARTEFLDASGQPIGLSSGAIWIEVVPKNIEVTYEVEE